MRQRRQLMLDLNPSRVATLSKGRSSLSYLEAWDVKASLIRVFGFGGFSAEADECEVVRIEDNVPKVEWKGGSKTVLPIEFDPDGRIKYGTANFRVNVRVRVKLTIHQLGAVYTEWAACSQTGPDLGEVTDFAIKTAESDALKRAAIYLGTQFGLSLYASDKDHVHYSDVVKNVLADGQEWPPSPRQLKQEREDFLYATLQSNGNDDVEPGERPEPQQQMTPQQEVGMLDNIVHGQRPGPVMQTPFEGGPSALTPELREQTNALIERGLQMQRANGDPMIDNGPAGVLDRSLDGHGDEAEAMAAADGHHE
jgi:hypothetical protein